MGVTKLYIGNLSKENKAVKLTHFILKDITVFITNKNRALLYIHRFGTHVEVFKTIVGCAYKK